MLLYNLWKSVNNITEDDIKHVIAAYQKLWLSCVSNLYRTLSLDDIKKQSSCPKYGYSYEITPDPFSFPDNKLIFTTRDRNAVIQIIPNTDDKIISQQELHEIFSNIFNK